MPDHRGSVDGRRRLARLRLAAQLLGPEKAASPVDAVRSMLALQGQDFAGAKWSVGLRCADCTEAAVEAAFDSRGIVRSWPLRGTLHVVAAEDLAWMQELTAPRATASVAARRAALGLTEADTERARSIALDGLSGGRLKTRADLLGAFDAGGVSIVGQRGYHLIWYLAQTGTIVMGASDGRQQTFARLDEWVPHPRRLERDDALGELALRFFRGHGPATVPDLARWSGLTIADVRRGLAVAGDALAAIEVDGTRYHVRPDLVDAPAPDADVVLLPGFDEYILGYRDRTAVLAPEHSEAIIPGGNGMFKATIVVDGEVVGTWSRTVSARHATIEVTPFEPLPSAVLDGLRGAAAAYGRFLGREARIALPMEAG